MTEREIYIGEMGETSEGFDFKMKETPVVDTSKYTALVCPECSAPIGERTSLGTRVHVTRIGAPILTPDGEIVFENAEQPEMDVVEEIEIRFRCDQGHILYEEDGRLILHQVQVDAWKP
jgi:hypothetical protein